LYVRIGLFAHYPAAYIQNGLSNDCSTTLIHYKTWQLQGNENEVKPI